MSVAKVVGGFDIYIYISFDNRLKFFSPYLFQHISIWLPLVLTIFEATLLKNCEVVINCVLSV